MNDTPRLRSAFPSTPNSTRRNLSAGLQHGRFRSQISEPALQIPRQDDEARPLIPFSILDAPSQRLYASAFYLALTAWRTYDLYYATDNQLDSVGIFLKWLFLDAVFLFGLPELRIPWLEWSASTTFAVYLSHALVTLFILFPSALPLRASIPPILKIFYDRELAVSERRVNPVSLLKNSSLIIGKQIVHILPEGSAMLNPGSHAFCLDTRSAPIDLPILINQTNPILIELSRTDLETGISETITIGAKEAKKLKRRADKDVPKTELPGPRTLRYQVRHTGVYRLTKVIDESNLEVQRQKSKMLVVPCPTAQIESAPQDKCRSELSDLHLQVNGIPPFRVRYSRRVNKEEKTDVLLTVYPPEPDASRILQEDTGAVSRLDDGNTEATSARPHGIRVPVNETLGVRGVWVYSVDEVHDAVGNVVHYGDQGKNKIGGTAQSRRFIKVHDAPELLLDGCSSQQPLKVAKGESTFLPIWLNPAGSQEMMALSHKVAYTFIPGDSDDQERAALSHKQEISLKHGDSGPRISEPGLYSLTSVSNKFCKGQIIEPSSCLLLNPPEPDVSITAEPIPHHCAGNSIGLLLSLDFVGTPPFYVSYTSRHNSGRVSSHVAKVDSLRSQLELKPREPGHYVYEFLTVSDAVYHDLPLKQDPPKFETDVKPTALARFTHANPNVDACIDQPVALDVVPTGEAPFTLEYEIVHEGKRKKYKETGIPGSTHTITTPLLDKGGQHIVGLTSITDASGCKILLKEEARVQVRHQKPSAAFGLVEGQRDLLTLEGKRAYLPLRLAGEPPYTIAYSRTSRTGISHQTLKHVNDELEVDMQDTYRLEKVQDIACPGSIDPSANEFHVRWIPRPKLHFAESELIKGSSSSFERRPVCEGDQDTTEINLSGNAPYHIEYDIHSKPLRGQISIQHKSEDVALQATTVKMQTERAGLFEYRFFRLGDRLYDASSVPFPTRTLQQQVYSQPSAKFTNVGKIYSYCKVQTSINDVVPISLSGQPPFVLELGIRHHGSALPEIVKLPGIHSREYKFHIPREFMTLGTHSLTIRKVLDANGCESGIDLQARDVRVQVVDVPTVSAMEPGTDYCVGDRISFSLSGTPPFSVMYDFEGKERKTVSYTTSFRRLAEKPGNFTVKAISDKASGDSCQARTQVTKIIHPLPSVRMSKGRVAEVDIHEGGEAELQFEFEGTPPFEFTYTRSTTASKGRKSVVLETKLEVSEQHTKSVKVSEEGTYEVTSIKDRFCAISLDGVQGRTSKPVMSSNRLLANSEQ